MLAHWITCVCAVFMLSLDTADDCKRADKPNFTGRWRFNPTKSRLQIPSPSDSRFEIRHDEPRFHLTRTLVFGEKTDTVTFDMTTDDKESVHNLGNLQACIRARWEGNTLVLDSTITAMDDAGRNLVRYRLEDGGATFIADESWRSSKYSYDNIWVFDRSSSNL